MLLCLALDANPALDGAKSRDLTAEILYSTSLLARAVKCLRTMWETQVQSLDWKDLLEKEMTTHSSTLAWQSHGKRIVVGYSPWGHRVGHN